MFHVLFLNPIPNKISNCKNVGYQIKFEDLAVFSYQNSTLILPPNRYSSNMKLVISRSTNWVKRSHLCYKFVVLTTVTRRQHCYECTEFYSEQNLTTWRRFTPPLTVATRVERSKNRITYIHHGSKNLLAFPVHTVVVI